MLPSIEGMPLFNSVIRPLRQGPVCAFPGNLQRRRIFRRAHLLPPFVPATRHLPAHAPAQFASLTAVLGRRIFRGARLRPPLVPAPSHRHAQDLVRIASPTAVLTTIPAPAAVFPPCTHHPPRDGCPPPAALLARPPVNSTSGNASRNNSPTTRNTSLQASSEACRPTWSLSSCRA